MYLYMPIGSLQHAVSRSTGADRRREERVRFSRMIEIHPCDEDSVSGTFLRVELYDCSEHGVAFYLDRELARGSEFLLRIQLAETQIVLYTVRNCIQLEAGKRYRIGAEFTSYIAASADTTRRSIVEAVRSLPEN